MHVLSLLPHLDRRAHGLLGKVDRAGERTYSLISASPSQVKQGTFCQSESQKLKNSPNLFEVARHPVHESRHLFIYFIHIYFVYLFCLFVLVSRIKRSIIQQIYCQKSEFLKIILCGVLMHVNKMYFVFSMQKESVRVVRFLILDRFRVSQLSRIPSNPGNRSTRRALLCMYVTEALATPSRKSPFLCPIDRSLALSGSFEHFRLNALAAVTQLIIFDV